MLQNKYILITFLRVSTKSQILVAASYISFMPFTVENISLLCSQRIGKRNSFVYKGIFEIRIFAVEEFVK